MSKWIGMNAKVHGNAEVFGTYYIGSNKAKQAKIKQKKQRKTK